jgi:hypothetical protein
MVSSFGVFFLVILSFSAATPLPTSWIGHWHGIPEYSSTGPKLQSGGGISFTVAAIDENHWFVEDTVGESLSLFHSQQQFFMNSFDNGAEGSYGRAEYCGWLAGYYLNMPHHGPVFNMVITTMSELAMTFKYNKSMQANATLWMPWNVEWWWTRLDNDTMTSFIQLPSGPEYYINHLLVNLTRVSHDPMPYLSATGRAAVLNKATQPQCNFTSWPIPLPPQPNQTSAGPLDTALDGGKFDPRIMCPHGFTNLNLPMPQFVKDRLAARRRMDLPTLGDDDAGSDRETVAPLTSGTFADSHASRQYQYCVRVNTFHNFTVEYTYNTQTQSVDVMLSARPQSQPASASWIAIGIMPAWPSMLGMDIVLGYFGQISREACIRSMFAEQNTGTPVENPRQMVKPVSVFTSESDKVLHMQFSRPWTTGYWDLSQGPVFNNSYPFIPIPVIAWALGAAPADCTADPSYHGAARGTHGFSWPAPKTAIIPQAFCDGQWPK